jgi:hypothetical protein
VDFNVKRRVCDDECKNANLAVISELNGELAIVVTNDGNHNLICKLFWEKLAKLN